MTRDDLSSTIAKLESKEAATLRKVRKVDAKLRGIAGARREVLKQQAQAETSIGSSTVYLKQQQKALKEAKARLKEVQRSVRGGSGESQQHASVAASMLGTAAGRYCLALERHMGSQAPVGPIGALFRIQPQYRKWRAGICAALQDILSSFRCETTKQFEQARKVASASRYDADLRAFRPLDPASIADKTLRERPDLAGAGGSEAAAQTSSSSSSAASAAAAGRPSVPVLPFLVSDAIVLKDGTNESESCTALHALHSHSKAHRIAVVQDPKHGRALLESHPKLLRCVVCDKSGGVSIIGRSGVLLAGSASAKNARGKAKQAPAAAARGMFLRPISRSVPQVPLQTSTTESALAPFREDIERCEVACNEAEAELDGIREAFQANSQRLEDLSKREARFRELHETHRAAADRYKLQVSAVKAVVSSEKKGREKLVEDARSKERAVYELRGKLQRAKKATRRYRAALEELDRELAPVEYELRELERTSGSRKQVRTLQRQAQDIRAEADDARTEARTIKIEYDRLFSRRQKRKLELAERKDMVEKGDLVIDQGWREVLGDEYDPEGHDEREQAPMGMEDEEAPITKERLQERLRTLEVLRQQARLKAEAARRAAKGKAPSKRTTDDILRAYQRAQKKMEVNEQQIEIATRMYRRASKMLKVRHKNMLRLVEEAQQMVRLKFRQVTMKFPFKRTELIWAPDDKDDPTQCGCLHIDIVPYASDLGAAADGHADGGKASRRSDDDGADEDEDEDEGKVDDGTGRVNTAASSAASGSGAGAVDYDDDEGVDDSEGLRAGSRRGSSASSKGAGPRQDHHIEIGNSRNGMSVHTRRVRNSETVLSGGEKSAVSIGLIMAMAAQIETPLRLLDEFDVYQDETSRQLSMQALLQGAFLAASNGNINGHQTVLLTPHDVSSAPMGRYPPGFVKVFRMPEPKRVGAAAAAAGTNGAAGGGAGRGRGAALGAKRGRNGQAMGGAGAAAALGLVDDEDEEEM